MNPQNFSPGSIGKYGVRQWISRKDDGSASTRVGRLDILQGMCAFGKEGELRVKGQPSVTAEE